MATTAAVLNIVVNAQTNAAQAQLTALDARLKKTAASSTLANSKFAKGAVAAAGGLAALSVAAGVAGKQLYDLGVEFDDAYDKIRVGTGATGKELDRLKKSFKEVAKDVPNDFGEVGQAVADVNTRMGLMGKPLERMTENFLHLSNATGTDLQGNIKSVARAFTDWEVPVKRQTAALDGLFRLQQESGATVAELADNIQKFGSPLRTLGLDMDYAAAMFANFERAGVNMQTMVPGLKLAIGNISAPTDELAGKLDALGVSAENPAEGLQKLFDALGNQSSLSKVEKINLAMDVFGRRAGADMAEAVRQGRFNVDRFMEVFNDKNGDSIRKAADESYDFSENAKILANNLKLYAEPAANAVFVAADNAVRALVKINRILSGDRKTYKNAGSAIQTISNALYAVGKWAATAWRIVKDKFQAIGRFVSSVLGSIGKGVKFVGRLFDGDFVGALEASRAAASKNLKGIKAIVQSLVSPFARVFEAILDIIRDKFSGAYSAVAGFVNGVIDVINLIPGVDIDPVSSGGGGGKGDSKWNLFQRGGELTGGKPSGDSIPALLERGEYVLNRKAVQRVGVDRLNDLNFRAASRFQSGGPVGMIGGGMVDKAISAVGKVVGKGAGFFIDKLPDPNIPAPLTGVGPWMVEQVTDWIKGKVKGPGDGSGPLGGFSGSLARAMSLAISHGLTITSTTGGTHAPGSYHYQGRAFDASNSSGPTPEMMAYFLDAAGRWGQNMLEHFYDPAGWYIDNGTKVPGAIGGHSDHVHTAMQRGGLIGGIRRMRDGGFVGNINRRYREHNSANGDWGGTVLPKFVIAALAQAAGMPGRTMEQVTRGESGGRPGATGIDPGGTKGLGLWMVTTGYNDDLIRKYGGQAEMLNPVKNAAAAAEIYRRQGLGAWYGTGAVTGDGLDYTGKYNIQNALGGLGFRAALAGKKPGKNKPKGPPTGGVSPDWKGPPNQASLARAEKMRKAAARKRRRIYARIAGADRFPYRDDLKKNGGLLARVAEQIGIAETNAAGEWGPGGSELTEAEVAEQVRLYKRQLKLQQARKRLIEKAVKHMIGVRKHLEGLIKKAGKKGSTDRWKLGAYRSALGGVKDILRNTLAPGMEELVGVTGKGGAMFETRTRLKELGVATTTEGTRDADLAALLREQLTVAQRSNAILSAQMPIYQQFLPKYHTGGIVAGAGEVPIMAQAGEGVFTRDQMAAMGGAQNITVIVEDGAVNSDRIRVEVDGVLAKHISGARRSTGGRKFVTNG